ncbi:MAG TPA: protein translocase subunit SecF [candidate division Zixibacteria bacterium]|nr:protein translocase subunit SecF [candidate division Zixibacteria bacterium]
MFRIIGETHIDFIGLRKIAFVLSSCLIILGLIGFVMISFGKANLGIDFAGGIMIQGYFDKPVKIDDLRNATVSEFPDIQITHLTDFEKANAFIVKVKQPQSEQESKEKLAALKSDITGKFAGNAFTIVSEHVIGPAVGETLRRDARWAVLLSMFGIIIYIWIRFDFRSGIAATIATFHDVLAVLGIFFIFRLEFDSLIVTALLTLAGYSLTDTVVVYDRIRENLRKFRSKGEFANAVNVSINEMLSRTINTSMTVLIVVGILFVFGGEVLHNFALALFLGVIVGTYSSVFVASPIVVEWEARSPKRFK